MIIKNILTFGILGLPLTTLAQATPNIVLINADDLGYGDISRNGMTKAHTPNIDALASSGINLTNMHASSATSTPSRFSMLTGTYAWRTAGTGVAPGDAAMIIRPEMKTLPDMLKRAGYTTAAVGKWHLGIGDKTGKQNWNGQISPGLSDIGFDYSYIMAATSDRVPCVYIENGKVVDLDINDPIEVSYTKNFDGEPTGKNNPEMLKLLPSHGHNQSIIDSVSRIGFMRGGKSALWKDENIADSITAHALRFIERNKDGKFFLYLATNDIHVPRVPHKRFVGKTDMGARGDAIMSLDWTVGQVIAKLEELGLTENTLVIFTSDNGPVLDDGYQDRARELAGSHKPGAWMRGGKYSIFEAGTRIPFIAKWPGHIPEGKASNAAMSQIDLFATFASIVGQTLSQDEAFDSENHIKILTGKDKKGREYIIEDAYARSITMGNWKYIAPSNSIKVAWETGNETGSLPQPQLFNIKKDPKETTNVAQTNPQIVEKYAAKLKAVQKRDNKQ